MVNPESVFDKNESNLIIFTLLCIDHISYFSSSFWHDRSYLFSKRYYHTQKGLLSHLSY